MLKARELVRRNAQSDLPRPPFWPAALAPFFWPLILLASAVLLWTGLRLLPASGSGTGGEDPAALVGEAVGAEQPPEQPAEQADAGSEAPRSSGEDSREDPSDAETAPPEDPLVGLFNDLEGATETDPLVVGVSADPAGSRMTLRLSPAFDSLAAEIRERRADLWLQQARQLGYENLELLDRRGRLVGRRALVGSGMILLGSAAK